MLLFSAVVYLYWRICAVCLPAPLLPRPLSSWPSLSRPSPHPLPGICLPLLLLQQCGVLCLMLCRLWRGCCHDNVEVVFCMELFTKGVLYRFGHVKCDVSLVVHVCLHGEDPLPDNVQSNIKGVTRCLAIHLTGLDAYTWRGEYAHCHPSVRPSILGALWCHTALISQVGLKRCCYGTSEGLVCFPLELWYLCLCCLDLAKASECSSKEEVVASFGAILWCFQACGERLRNYCLSEEKEMVVAGFAVSTQVLDEPELIHYFQMLFHCDGVLISCQAWVACWPCAFSSLSSVLLLYLPIQSEKQVRHSTIHGQTSPARNCKMKLNQVCQSVGHALQRAWNHVWKVSVGIGWGIG